MPWKPLPHIAFGVAICSFATEHDAELPVQIGDELYIIEQGGANGEWYRGYLVAPPSVLGGLTSSKGQTLEARVFSGIFPRSCVEVREELQKGDGEAEEESEDEVLDVNGQEQDENADPEDGKPLKKKPSTNGVNGKHKSAKKKASLAVIDQGRRDPNAPKPLAPMPTLKIGDETPTSADEPLVDEIASCLREWHSRNLHELILSKKYPLLDEMFLLVPSLDLARRQLLHNVLTTHELGHLREKTVWDLVRGNKAFNSEIIVRDPSKNGRVLTGEDSAVEITRLQSMMSLLDERPQPANDNLTLHHLLVDVKTFVGTSTESTTLVFFVASKTPGQAAVALSESYIVEVPPSGAMTSLANTVNMRTLFADFASADIGDSSSPDNELYLVVKVRATQQVVSGRPESKSGPGTNAAQPFASNSIGRAGRRSLMWGQKAQRNAFSRNSPISSKMDQLSELNENPPESREGPPKTANSQSGNERKASLNSRIITRTVGIGAVKVNNIMKELQEEEKVVPMWSPAASQEKQEHGEGWEDVIEDLMDSKSGQFELSRRAERLQVYLKGFNAPDAEGLIRSTPTLLSGITQTSKMGFSGAPTKSRSDIYITLNEAFLPRQALLSRSTGSATPLSNQILGSHLQITLEVRKAHGDRLEGCIFPSSNAESQSTWESTVTERGEGWTQTLKLLIPTLEVPGCHLVMTLSDVPNAPFAICYMPLWDQQAFIRDGHHSLLLYRYDETTNTAKGRGEGRTGYLGLPWNARGKDDVSKDEAVTGPIATLRVQTYLCSTRFSQDKVLLGLLKWKEQAPGDVQELLKRLVFVPEIEIVKLLNDVFDAIFGILVEQAGNDEYEDLIFSALVTVLGIVHDRRFNLGPLVDHYAETQFNYPFATGCLVRSFTRMLAKPSEPDTARKLRATFKVVRHILKFITHARSQQVEKEAGIGITSTSSTSPSFTRDLRNIFKSLDGLMRNTSPVLVGSQTLAVQHFHTWLPELTGLLSTEEIVHIAIDFMDSCSAVKGKLILYKLVLIINYSKLELFSQPEQREALCMNTVRWIAPHWGKTDRFNEQWREQVRLCCTILSTQVQNLANEIPDYIPKIIDSYLGLQSAPKPDEKTRLSLPFPSAYPFPTKPISSKDHFDEALVELSAILSAISNLPAGMQLELAEDEMATLLEEILQVHLSILNCDAFPSNWLSLHLYHHKSTMKTLDYVANILLDSFLPHPDDADSYHIELWKMFFKVLLKLVGSDVLALETFTEQKRRAVWKICGDIRETGAALMRRTWEATGWEATPNDRQHYGIQKYGGYQVQFVPSFVGPIVELCLSVHEGLRRVAVEMLQSMIVSEWEMGEDVSIIQTEMIDCLDHLLKTKPLTESILQKLFINELLSLFDHLADIPDEPLYAAIKELIATIDEYLDLLVAVYSSDFTGEASQLIHRLALMEFLRDMRKEEIFIRYVHHLAQLQADANNSTEAGLALRLHADLYDWDPTKIVPPLVDPEFPAQSEFDRKERIYFDIIKHFEDGEAWSSALAAYEELQTQYMENTYDYPKLVRTQRAIATIYESISKSEKVVSHYFRVSYRGMGFPPNLRDKDFIFEGSPTEKMAAFTDRMQAQHPSAHIVNADDIRDVEGQFLLISQLTPFRDLEHHVFQRARVPHIVRDYLLSAHPNTFSITSKRSTSGEISSHMAEKIIFKTAEAFPTILRRSEVISVERVQYGPLETALERVTRRTSELAGVEKKVMEGDDSGAHALIDALSVACNIEAETSMSRYRALLPVTDSENPVELLSLENALKVALIDHAVLIKRCLTMFAKPDKEHLMGEAEREALTNNFEDAYAPELLSFGFPTHIPSRNATPEQSWAHVSPALAPGASQNRMSLQRPSPGGQHMNTHPTLASIDTGILFSDPRRRSVSGRRTPPPAGRHRKRLSFLHRQTGSVSEGQAVVGTVLSPITGSAATVTSSNSRNSFKPAPLSLNTGQGFANGNGNGNSTTPITPVKQTATFPGTRGRGKSNASSQSQNTDLAALSHSLSVKSSSKSAKDKRTSFFTSGGGSLGRGASPKIRDLAYADESSGWMTEGDSRVSTNAHGGEVRESGEKEGKNGGEVKSAGATTGAGGGLKKRLSLLRLGKKASKVSVMVGSVAEEE